jgi:hypothetical protein
VSNTPVSPPTSLSPRDGSLLALKEHVTSVASRLGLSKEQVSLLVSEVRNAIAPAVLNLTVIEQDADFDQEGLEIMRDIKNSHGRVIALMNALDESIQ